MAVFQLVIIDQTGELVSKRFGIYELREKRREDLEAHDRAG